MHRFYLPPEESSGDVLLLAGREAHHAAHVVRLKVGERVEVLDGAGGRFACEVKRVDRKKIELAVHNRETSARRNFHITLLQAIVKGKTMESIVQKATELGVTRIVPMHTERVVPNIDSEAGGNKLAKWQITAIESIKQCGSPWLPRIDAPVTPAGFLKYAETFDLSLVGSLQGDGRHVRSWFAELETRPRNVAVWIGPEGDFTAAELDLIRSSGAKPVTLGDLVLRADTAAIYCLAVIQHELEWLNGTESKHGTHGPCARDA